MNRNEYPDRLLLIGAGAMAEGYLESAERSGLSLAIVETGERIANLRARFSSIVDSENLTGPPSADESWVAPAFRLLNRFQPTGVLGFAEPQVLAAALVQDSAGLPGPGLAAAVISRNKALQRSRFALTGVDQPEHLFVDDLHEGTDWVASRLPVVVKSLSGMGSIGVEQINDAAAWAEVVERRRGEGALLIEEYIEGPEFSIEGLLRGGDLLFTNVTRKDTTGAPFFVETAHAVGAGVNEPTLVAAAETLCVRASKALHILTGIVHLEFKARSAVDLVIMELAVRTPGDHIMEIISTAHGFDFYSACIDVALGRNPELPSSQSPQRSSGVVYISAADPGIVAEIDIQAWHAVPGFTRSYMMADPGDSVRPPESSSERLGYGILNCADPETLARSMAALRRSVVMLID